MTDIRITVIQRVLFSICLSIFFFGCGPVSETPQSDRPSVWDLQPNQSVVFMAKTDTEEGELYLLKKDGSIDRLTTNNRHENNPALAPDGRKVAFHGGDIQNPLSWEIYVLDLETGQERQLTDNQVIDGHPDWSPDGTRIVFGSFRDGVGNPSGTADLFIIDLETGRVTQITDSPWEDNDPEWSPDGSKIAFKSTRWTEQAAREEICFLDLGSKTIQRLTETKGWESDHDPSWSPDGSTIVFSRFEGLRPWTDIATPSTLMAHWQEMIPWNVFQVDLSGQVSKLTNAEFIASLPVYRSDGRKILYLEFSFIFQEDQLVGGNHELILINLAGTESERLIDLPDHAPTMEYHDW
jgi:Tol biopolymer transport system component